jgi:PPOX class probable FMN-dependent enzyme
MSMNAVNDQDSLRALYGEINPLALIKVMPKLDEHSRAFIARSPFLVLATAHADGGVDASPRGDGPGFVAMLDDNTLLLPDRPGNHRVDSFSNILTHPGVGLLFFVPGLPETLRVNGTAQVTTDARLLEPLQVQGKVPEAGLLIAIQEVFFHCGKALIRSKLWDAGTQIKRSDFPSLGRIIAEQTRAVKPADADVAVENGYRNNLY